MWVSVERQRSAVASEEQKMIEDNVESPESPASAAPPCSPDFFDGELYALRYIRGWMESKRACNLNAAATSMINEMQCHCDAAIERLERGDPMESFSEIC